MSESKRVRVAPIVALVVAPMLAGLLWVLAAGDGEEADPGGVIDSHLLDEPAPAVVAPTLDGAEVDLSRRKGSWVVLNFFNSTCAPCRAEHAELVQFVADQQQFLGSQAAEFYTVVQIDDDLDDVRAFFADRGGDWPILTDTEGGIFVDFGVAQVPETFIIDPNGVVRVRWAGTIDAVTLGQLVQQQRLATGL